MITPHFSKFEAREALQALSTGIPPADAIMEFISVGLDTDLKIFEEEYFSSENGTLPNTEQGVFKIVEAYYGGGKTHYLRSVERLAHRHGFASSFIELHKDSCPLTNFELVYQKFMEKLTLPATLSQPRAVGIEQVLRRLILPPNNDNNIDAATYADTKMRRIRDLPFPGMRIILSKAALAIASDDRNTLDECLIYLRSGKMSPNLRRKMSLEPIDKKTGILAIRSIIMWLRQMGLPGLVFIMDEGDRSLSLSHSSDKTVASNNLVQLINETASGWGGVMFLYSIPSWDDFRNTFGSVQALIQRVQSVGFPSNPLATRITLDERDSDIEAKNIICQEVSVRLVKLFQIAHGLDVDDYTREKFANMTTEEVIRQVDDVYYRRLFFQSFIAVLFKIKSGNHPTSIEIEEIVSNTPQN
jgi:hypothetical protein